MTDDDANRLTPAASAEDLNEGEQRAVDHQSRPSAALIHETIRVEGERELERSGFALMMSGLAAGLSIGFSVVVPAILIVALPEAPWKHLLTSLGYTVGFLIVVLGRQQLFTENTLTPVLPMLRAPSWRRAGLVLRLWLIVLLSNVAATWIFSAVLAHTPVFEPEIKQALAAFSQSTMASPFWTMLLKAVFAGWLIALMVWLMPASGDSKPFVIIIVTYVVAVGHFAHIIAGSVEASYLVQIGEATLRDYVLTFFVPTLLGNMLGGIALVACFNFGQVAPELQGSDRRLPRD
ncbi:formate/nitrite transporter family protein [Aureimonas phyllosphaerae]|uniref:Formate/nitrite transporter FocA (FNT family) n=1 Tax=Aureimonas phyllosphaerae TaxID=1166078 RepID=A0A7W6BZI0_9HYPH|nr:formate/nitrite transporter family protein [Aureimonas phyllosphaerae]MBB3937615.1 formate/nitrite transporter FocA (FNT family) [Aureimonas phyllosphaerae]MBB3961585.1 formate/nitrite transporter FocA (FNT family) [Aureimonas phyllosphaerae]SFF46844.1 Formate/nitrite transporter FocA, FNT family [Aureimonas phyllosphaerae]